MMATTTPLPSGGSDKIPPGLTVKRPAGDPAEEDCSRGQTRRALSEPTSAVALAPVKAQHRDVGQWSGTLIWHREKSDVRLQVLAIDTVRHPNAATLPTSLRVEILASGTQTRDIQAYIREKRRRWCGSRTHFAIARCEAQGKDSPFSSLLLAPLNKNLICAILPTSNPQDLPKARPRPPLEEWERNSGTVPLRSNFTYEVGRHGAPARRSPLCSPAALVTAAADSEFIDLSTRNDACVGRLIRLIPTAMEWTRARAGMAEAWMRP
ncbi:hypothetical protein BC827DRAFT_1156228 [Russula dissimulans]|nr:hypothetical protein BC827DRAFT_1156228 [Russula dissimulans]